MLRILALSAAGAATILLAAFAPSDPRPECEVAREWVASHTNELPTTLARFEEFTPRFRRNIYSVLDHDTKVRLWHEQFARYLGARSPLTPRQKDLLPSLDEQLPRLVGDTAATNALRPLLAAEFKQPLLRSVFIVLGHERDKPVIGYAYDKLGTTSRKTDCTCAFSGDCSLAGSCNENPFCIVVKGCGIAGNYDCTGTCTL